MGEILTLGHSTMAYGDFLGRLRDHGVTAVADVRSVPHSGRHPHFSGPELRARLASDGIAYVFLGRELGGRPERPDLFRGGVADYEAMARVPAFSEGIRRVCEGSRRHRIAMTCSEGDPMDCHRCLLVGRAMASAGLAVRHLTRSGGALGQGDVEAILMESSGFAAGDLFGHPPDALDRAYRARAHRVAYRSRPQG